MSDKVEVRQAEIRDIPYIKELLLQLYNTISNNEGLDQMMIEHNLAKVFSDEHSILIAEKQGSIVGMIYVIYHQSLLHYGLSACIEELVVHKGFRGQGIGKLLVEKGVEMAHEKGCVELEVSTEFTNKEAISFYEKFGFKQIGVLLEMELDS
ncbi:MAG: GNAT family N-acetyltransferase [Candidatus Cloacimonetes bacterium]|nr:GNAT family N-acetyltransferase [Candidatus Cloacimonadota bacterium]